MDPIIVALENEIKNLKVQIVEKEVILAGLGLFFFWLLIIYSLFIELDHK